MVIETVKAQPNSTSYWVNGTRSVNVRGDRLTPWGRETKAWLDAGGVPEPAFTADEMATNTRHADNATHRAYLAETDWYVTRNLEEGTPVPAAVTTARQAARAGVLDGT